MRSHSSRRPPSRSLGGLLTRREGPSCSTGYHQRSKNLSPVAKPHLSCLQPCSSRASSIATFDDGAGCGRRQCVPRWSAWRRRALRKGLVRLARRTNGPLVRVRKGPRKPLAPPGAPSPCEKGKGNREAGHPGPEKQTTGAAQRWLKGGNRRSDLAVRLLRCGCSIRYIRASSRSKVKARLTRFRQPGHRQRGFGQCRRAASFARSLRGPPRPGRMPP
jgi:hypothetical protein